MTSLTLEATPPPTEAAESPSNVSYKAAVRRSLKASAADGTFSSTTSRHAYCLWIFGMARVI